MTTRGAHPNAGLSGAEVDELEGLLRRRAEELRRAARGQESLLGADDDVGDPMDRADEERRYRDAALLGEAERDELAAVERALAAIDNGTYGVSELSGKPIGIARLRAVPRATRTVEEAERQER